MFIFRSISKISIGTDSEKVSNHYIDSGMLVYKYTSII